MSKEKNPSPNEGSTKKERISILEQIRRRTGLLVGIVGLALIIFILESLLGSGSSIFGGDEYTTVGSINGKKVDRNEFINRVDVQLNNYRQRNQNAEVNDQTRASIIDNVWNQYVVDLAIRPQFEKCGLTVGEDELYDRVVANPVDFIKQQLSDPQTGRINEQFARPDGSLDLVKWKQAVQNLPVDQEQVLLGMEENVKTTRYFEKFRNLITKGMYTTAQELKAQHNKKNTSVDFDYVLKRYDAVSDSSVKISEAEIEKYYKENSYRFKNPETTRSIDYVVFNVVPSEADIAAIEKEAQRAAEEFKGKTASEDSLLIAQESENGEIRIENFNRKTMIVRDSSVFTAAPGTVFGPYNEGAYFKIYKLQATTMISDSCEVRHILIGLNDPQTQQPKRSKEAARREADSLLVLLKTKRANFDSLVKTVSDDMGSKTNGGNYGWFDENKGFVEPFKNFGLRGTAGDIGVVETDFGYHIMEVLNVSKTRHNSYRVAQIFKAIQASDETNQEIFGKASQFAGENNDAERFDKAVDSQKLTKRIADNIREGDRQLSGLDQARDLVRWVYQAEKGQVNIFTLPNKHVVAKLKSIREKGILPLEEVKEEVTRLAIQKKKAEMFSEEFNAALKSARSLEELSSALKLDIKVSEGLNAANSNINGLGADLVIAGTALGSKQGQLSKVISADNGVAVLRVKATKSNGTAYDPDDERRQAEQLMSNRSDYEVFNALKEMAEIEDHKSRID